VTNELIGVSRIHTKKADLDGLAATIPTLFAYKVIKKLLTEIFREYSNKKAVLIPTPGLDPREHAYEFTQ
jgi:hypothetical protein